MHLSSLRGTRAPRAVLCAVMVLGLAGSALAGFPGTDVFVASVGHGSGAGGSQWRTTLWIHNPGTQAANCQVKLLLRNQANPSPPTYNLTVQPGDTVKYEDAVWTLFGIQGYGALRVVSDRDVVVGSRIYNQPGSDISDTQGQYFGAVPASFAIGVGQSTDVLGVNQAPDGAFRFNYGFVEATGNTVTFQVTLLDGDGTVLGQRAYTLQPYEAMQVGLIDLGAGDEPTENGRLHVEVTGGSGRVIAFGSGVANASQDPSTFEMTFAQQGSGQGLTSVAHDATLTGDGTAGSPLGIADGGVTASKIANGTVVRSLEGVQGNVDLVAGSGVTITPDAAGHTITLDAEGLVLPFSANMPSSATLLAIQNSGSGRAMVARQGSGSGYTSSGPVFDSPGLWAESSDSHGIVSSSSALYGGGIAAFALGQYGRAVYANAAGDDGDAIYAVAAGTGSRAGYFQGNVEITGQAEVGSLAVTGNGGATTPIAYGFVRADGTLASGTSNVSVQWDAGDQRYEITISGENYFYQDYVTVVTPLGGNDPPVFAGTNSLGGHLLVKLYDLSGNLQARDFQFVTFKP